MAFHLPHYKFSCMNNTNLVCQKVRLVCNRWLVFVFDLGRLHAKAVKRFFSWAFWPDWSRPSSLYSLAVVAFVALARSVRRKHGSAFAAILSEACLVLNHCNCVHVWDCAIMPLVACTYVKGLVTVCSH